jgi:hypothetical protein
MNRHKSLLSLFISASVILNPLAIANADNDAKPNGSVSVTITAPEGVAASVVVTGQEQEKKLETEAEESANKMKPKFVATKASAGTVSTTVLQAPKGGYHVYAHSVTVNGRFYTATRRPDEVEVKSGKTTAVNVTYTLNDAARDLHASNITQSLISLTWTALPQYKIIVRRTTTMAPALTPSQGLSVPVVGGTATDSGLTAGTSYTYSLFARGAEGKTVGPFVVRAATVSTDPNAATYVANAQTQILTEADFVSASPNGAGVTLVLGPTLTVPVIGSAIVLPITADLAGGFLGLVTSVSADGQTVQLVTGAISDAFDFYSVSVPDFSALAAPAGFAQKIASPATPTPPTGPIDRVIPNPSGTKFTGATKVSAAQKRARSQVGPAPAPAAAGSPSCLGGGADLSVDFTPTLSVGGHFNGTVTKYETWLVDIPTGATMDFEATVTAGGSASVSSSVNISCSLPINPKLFPIPTTPVPLGILLTPNAGVTLTGGTTVKNIGLTVTAGVKAAGKLSITDGASFSGSPILTSATTQPTVVANGSIGVKLGGSVTFGPSIGTSEAGVIAGISVELNLVDASLSAVFPVSDPRFNTCVTVSVKSTIAASLKATAFVGNWATSATVNIPGLAGDKNWLGTPRYYPAGCNDTPTQPSDSVLGGGVIKETDTTTGSPTQVGYVPGLVPDKKAWVLSTGNFSDIVGSPGSLASTSLGLPGDADLSALAGKPTYDAVTYSVTLATTGTMLHVRYVFASEEYLQYVGSQFNDVMAVFVNGVNCAVVPGTSTPISINTVNPGANAQYYINSSGSGYNTKMNGLTVPLQCDVPITPGQKVTVKIAVADASDGVLDSAVALLDQGIWAD